MSSLFLQLKRWTPEALLEKNKQVSAAFDEDLKDCYPVSCDSSQETCASGSRSNYSIAVNDDEDDWVNVSNPFQGDLRYSDTNDQPRSTTKPIENRVRRERRMRQTSFATIPPGRLQKSHHVGRCLIGVSKKLYFALVSQSACCAKKHVARICLDGFPLSGDETSDPDTRHLSLFLSYRHTNGTPQWHSAQCLLQRWLLAPFLWSDLRLNCSQQPKRQPRTSRSMYTSGGMREFSTRLEYDALSVDT